jgi:hypothetical protein
MKMENELQALILEHYANQSEHDTCVCRSGKCLVQCRDCCFLYPTSCVKCFIKAHRKMPFHWAYRWDYDNGHYTKQDYSHLSDNCAIQLGHSISDTDVCEASTSTLLFTVVHSNGIHATRIRYCRCPNATDKVTQLMRARLFPATPQDPKTAFTFTVLKDFHMHNLQLKCGAFDFMLSLRRLTDNVFTAKVPVSSHTYLRKIIV